jgi:hypothetical protein
VIENVLGSRPTVEQVSNLSLRELSELRDRLSELWEAQHDQKVTGGAYLLGDWLHAFWSEPMMRPTLSDSLLYYSNLLVLDPLADFFGDRSVLPEPRGIRYRRRDGKYNTVSGGPRQWSGHGSFEDMRKSPQDAAARVARIVKNIYDLDALVRSGVLVLRSQWPTLGQRAQQLAASVRHDIKSPEMQMIARAPRPATLALALWDNLRGAQVRLNGPVHPANEPWQTEPEFFYLAKTLAVADAAGSQYVPSTESDLELLHTKVNTALSHRHPHQLLREVSRLLVPSVDVPIQRAIEMRESSEYFEDWRSTLNQLRRAATASSADELRELVEDELRPRANAVKRDLKRSSLAASVRDGGAELAVTGAVGLGAALTTHEGYVTVGTGLGAGVLTWLVRAYTRKKPGGADAVLATLIKNQ